MKPKLLKYLNYINAIKPLILYKHSLSLFLALKAGILNMPGNKFNPKGYIIDNKKLYNVSLINNI